MCVGGESVARGEKKHPLHSLPRHIMLFVPGVFGELIEPGALVVLNASLGDP